VLPGFKERAPRMRPASGKLATACARESILRRCAKSTGGGSL
jgi:hypothetical protein